jgi:hypothetical protein
VDSTTEYPLQSIGMPIVQGAEEMDEQAPPATEPSDGFGTAEAYYSRRQGRTSPNMPPVLQDILPSIAGEEVDRARRNWNKRIRAALRTETGLRFASGQARDPIEQDDVSRDVKIEVIDGLSEPLIDIVHEYPDPIAWWILLNRPKLEAAADGLHVLRQRIPEIGRSSLGRQLSEGDPEAVGRSHDLIRRFLADEIDKPIVERIRRIERDWLGAYFFWQGRIELYAPAIALWSGRCGVPIEDMAIVVLAHELAHAFTHIGRDIDRRVWETDDFAKADTFLVEGLAQFYTDRVCDRLVRSRSALRTAFDDLNKDQSVLIDCRVSSIKDHLIFRSVLKTAHKRLTTAQRDFV